MSNAKKPNNPWLRLGPPGTVRTLGKIGRRPNRRRIQMYRRQKWVEQYEKARNSSSQ